MALIETRDLYKIYDVGESPVHALDGVSVAIELVRHPHLAAAASGNVDVKIAGSVDPVVLTGGPGRDADRHRLAPV